MESQSFIRGLLLDFRVCEVVVFDINFVIEGRSLAFRRTFSTLYRVSIWYLYIPSCVF